MWKEIKNEEDIKKVMMLYNNFHDSCIRDIYISTSDYVDKDLNMHFDNKSTASIIFQKQSKNYTVLELKFEGINHFNFKPMNHPYNGVIYDSIMKLENELFYWADSKDWEMEDIDSIWFSGKKLFYRFRTDILGNIKRLEDN
ncbi:hypothetical protein [Leptospira harrisiae]|uniref:hypothetical protein n=1 Tax=Leptospira harrisiae TaxID=2023189 RepID=UPI000C29F328|nr:hypothetical protein [Leptospira harrisiae]PKA06473.1 hypothetical protein CH366_18885 [Leptospira harrisiae]